MSTETKVLENQLSTDIPSKELNFKFKKMSSESFNRMHVTVKVLEKINFSKKIIDILEILLRQKKEETKKAIEKLLALSKTNYRFQDQAQCLLAYCYLEGIGVEQDTSMASNYFSAANELGNPHARGMMGYHYVRGIEVKMNIPLGLKLLNEASKMGSFMADYFLSELYEEGIPGFLSVDLKKAYSLLKKSALIDPAAKVHLGHCYQHGLGTKRDLSKAFKCYQEAADEGEIGAQVFVAKTYENPEQIGWGGHVLENPSKAVLYYMKASEFNDSYAVSKIKEITNYHDILIQIKTIFQDVPEFPYSALCTITQYALSLKEEDFSTRSRVCLIM